MIAAMARAVLVLAAFAAAPATIAQQASAPAPGADAMHASGNAGRDMAGRGAFNLAAGTGNVQANLAAIAIAASGHAVIELDATQRTHSGDRQRDASVRIDGQAFAGNRGLLSVNQVAGSGNAQLNLFALGNAGVELAGLGDTALAAVAGDRPEATEAAPGLRQAAIADDAFRSSQGVMQINQTAGVGNSSVNAIVLQLPGGPP